MNEPLERDADVVREASGVDAATKPPRVDTKLRAGLRSFLSSPLAAILLLFVASRGVLTLVGVLGTSLLGRMTGGRVEWQHPPYRWLDIWGQWDTGWFLDIANNGYSLEPRLPGQYNFVVFPLYPTLIKLLGAVIGNPYYAGLIISNLALVAAAYLLYRLVLLDHDREVALGSVKYLFVWPTSFLLSAILSESTFLALAIASFYAARKGRWVGAGVVGFFAALTRIIGVTIAVPLLYDYLREKGFSVRRIRLDVLALGLLPAGLLAFFAYHYYLTGDFLAYLNVQQVGWSRQWGNPLGFLADAIFGSRVFPGELLSAWTAALVLAALVIWWRRVPVSHLLYCLFAIMIPLSTGLSSMSRYLSILFPVFILLAQLGKDRKVDMALTIFLAVLQGALMIFWSMGTGLVI